MQGQRRIFDPFPESVDLNQGSVSHNSAIDQQPSWSNMINPTENHSSNYACPSTERNLTFVNSLGHDGRSFSGWALGESSSSASFQENIARDGLKMEQGWSPSFNTTLSGLEIRNEERQFVPSSLFLHDNFRSGFGQVTGGALPSQSTDSDNGSAPMNVNKNAGYEGSDDDDDYEDPNGTALFTDLFKSDRPEIQATASSSSIGPSSCSRSGYPVGENEGGTGSSLGSWSLSCKRKTLEGTSGQTFPSGSSSLFSQTENTAQHTVLTHNNASSSLSIASPSVNLHGEQLNPRIGVGSRGVPPPDVFPPTVRGIPESSRRNFGVRINPGHHDSLPFNISASGNPIRHSSVSDVSAVRPSAMISTNSSYPFPWNGPMMPRSGGSSNSMVLHGEGSTESNLRGGQRSSIEHPNFGHATDAINLMQDHPTNWSLGTGSSSASGVPSTSRNGPTSRSRLLPSFWLPHHNHATQSHQSFSDFSPWALFPSAEAESGSQRGHYPPFPSSNETMISAGGSSRGRHHQPFPGSPLMEVTGDDWRALAADTEGRQRLVNEIRLALNAMRRGENLRAEDYVLFDPFINGVAEFHDRHRDMRLDVDNMSYEELLALEEHIGNVNTGLSEETILKSMRQRKHISFMAMAPQNIEPCCICQEDYVTGEDVGTLDCGHDFHRDCIKQWLVLKNLCPICKMTALGT